jgi:hypothetical protein
MKVVLSVRVEVEVDVEDRAELDLIKRTYAERAAKACDTFMGNPRIIHAATVQRRSP